MEGDARFFRDPGGVGIEGTEKILDLLVDLLITRWDDFPWLNLVLHFLHSCQSHKP